MFLLDYQGNKMDIDFNFNVEDITIGNIKIITGDEVLDIVTKKGILYHFDSCNYREMDFFDGSYTIIANGKWVVDPIQWNDRKTSYDHYHQILDM